MTTSTQVQHPWRTTLRTIVWLLIALAPVVPTVWAIVQDEVTKAGLTIPPNVGAAVAFGVAIIVAVVGVVQRLVLIPAVAALVAQVPGLSPTPPVVAPVSPSTTVSGGVTTYDPGDGGPATTKFS